MLHVDSVQELNVMLRCAFANVNVQLRRVMTFHVTFCSVLPAHSTEQLSSCLLPDQLTHPARKEQRLDFLRSGSLIRGICNFCFSGTAGRLGVSEL